MRKIWTVCSLLIGIAIVFSACAAPAQPAAAPQPTAPAAKPVAAQPTAAPAAAQPAAAPAKQAWKACYVYNSPVGDAGWVFAANEGRKAVEKKLGIQTTFVENIPAGADAERTFSQLAESGCNEVVSTTNTYNDAVDRVAPKYPKVVFESYEGIKPGPNLRVYRLAQYEAYYVAGVLAGKMVKNGQAGWVAGFAAPAYPSFANSFVMGARSVNPNFKLNVVFMNKWSDPPGEKQAAESLAAAGAGLVTNSMSSPTVLQTAENKGIFSLGRTPQCSYAPKGCLASFVVNWEAIFEWQITSAMSGTLDSDQVYWANLSNNGVGLGELNPAVPADVKALLDQTKADVASGKIQIFKGPMKDVDGNEKIPAGTTLTPEKANLIEWFVDGVQVSKK